MNEKVVSRGSGCAAERYHALPPKKPPWFWLNGPKTGRGGGA